jgi:hypothetical protein
MNLFLPFPRATLLMPSGPPSHPGLRHLFVVMTDPVAQPDTTQLVVLVNITSVRPGVTIDATCRLSPGSHPFIRHDSYVEYRYARLEECNALLRGVRDGKLIPHSPMSEPIFARIADGMLRSPHLIPKIRHFYQATLERG